MQSTGKQLVFTGIATDKVINGLIAEHGGAVNTFETLFEVYVRLLMKKWMSQGSKSLKKATVKPGAPVCLIEWEDRGTDFKVVFSNSGGYTKSVGLP